MNEPRVTRWWWVRHAPVPGFGGAIYGDDEVDCDLSDAAALAAVAGRLPAGARWVSSHLGRARRTAAALAAHHPDPAPAAVEPDLGEQSFGDWQGRSFAELERSGDAVYHRFWLAPARHAPPGGESFVAMITRVRAVIDRLTAAHAGGDIVAVAHGGTVRAALAVALGVDPEAALAFKVDNLSLTRLERVEHARPGHDWRIVHVNLPPA